ncbi:MAG TPA: cyclic nucleotide-binding domain-containing protein [Thermodesulfobacteriota bacterium]|nr:cyclic nucleotide-binding domain-containing protein [Thermodesulfobacteriota bacterium]
MRTFVPLIDTESVFLILSKIAIFGGFLDRQLHEIFKYLEEGVFKEGEYIFQRDDDPSYIYIVKKGKIDLLIIKQEVILKKKTLSVGDCFGEASLMAMHKHTATAIALEDSEVMVLSRRALLQLRKEDTELFSLLMMNIARELARRLELTDELLLHYVNERKGA